MRKLIALPLTVVASVAIGFGATAPAGVDDPEGPLTISVSSGTVGTIVTVTGGDCGIEAPDISGDTGQLIVTVAGWPAPFDTGFLGGLNDKEGIATATFTVPNVAPGPYTIEVDCLQIVGGVSVGTIAPLATGPYPTPLSFTVIAPAPAAVAPVVPVGADPTTTG